MRQESEMKKRLEGLGITPTERLGQHILIDNGVLDLVTDQVQQGLNVLEIGCGPGNLTERIAQRAGKVVGVEIDRKFQPFLDQLQDSNPNVSIIYKDAMAVNFRNIVNGASSNDSEWQIASNLPFHISEPFLQKIADLPIDSASLVVGEQLARRMQIVDPADSEFSKTALITQTFFEPDLITSIEKRAFYPPPRTDAALVKLLPRDRRELKKNPRTAILRGLFLSEATSASVEKVIINSLGSQDYDSNLDKSQNNRKERRRLKMELRHMTRDWQNGVVDSSQFANTNQRREIENLGLSPFILSSPFSRLNNQDLRVLVSALNKRYGK